MKIQPFAVIIVLVSSASAFGLGWMLKSTTSSIDSDEEIELRAGQSRNSETNALAALPSKRPANRGASAMVTNASVEGAFAPYIRNGVIPPEEMAQAIKNVVTENDPLKKRALFSQLLGELTPENAVAAFDALREQSRGRGGWDRGGDDDMRLLLNAWGRIDGAGAVAELQAREKKRREEAAANGESGERSRWGGRDGRGSMDLYSVVNGWATIDSESASDFVNTIEDERQKGMLSSGIVRGLLVNGVDDALDYVSKLPAEDESRSRHMYTVAGEMLEQGTETAANWVSSIEDEDLRGGAMTRIADSFAREDLDGAISWATEHAGSEYANRAVTEVAERWAESDPQAVIDWASDLPETAQAGVYEEALDEWTERDPLAASEYLSKMPDSAAKNAAIEGFSTELAEEDGESAVTWAETITDPELRTRTLERVARDWYRQDKEAASQWLLQSGLPEESITNIAESAERGRRDWGRR